MMRRVNLILRVKVSAIGVTDRIRWLDSDDWAVMILKIKNVILNLCLSLLIVVLTRNGSFDM